MFGTQVVANASSDINILITINGKNVCDFSQIVKKGNALQIDNVQIIGKRIYEEKGTIYKNGKRKVEEL